ncbi:GDSL-like Lipase/Acylhydrolase [Anatilimnocola aggregata]|uniref:GDSL-like Lipase/Acylhydrolase n=1 Tax=Anatilimnocola aggregata TaxID=2528021 RepID=A0A517YIK3_9BACT|nr:SGNH/GDSL hydrolase family protein [Anatilimnocola aggregata]QDU30063.1 GDSL-like Lipase/Acylhydrolase [Anatilimnocola aggregata]
MYIAATRRIDFTFLMLLLVVTSSNLTAEEVKPLDLVKKSQRILFLGDSITASGQYVGLFDAWLVANRWEKTPTVINCGLASETVSGLSEEGHAGGKFPRPDLFERLDRVLPLVKPDLVFACYGINCGIYQPLDAERFARYQQGWQKLKEKVEGAGANLIIITPPFYDDLRSPKSLSYNEVLDRYSDWLVKQREQGWVVIDLHSAMTTAVKKQRQTEPKFTMQPDGVHPNSDGHWFMAQQLIAALGDSKITNAKASADYFAGRKLPAEALPLIQQRLSTLRDSYVGTAGHKRPGVAKGLPIEEATKKAEEITAKLNDLLK